MVRRSGPSALVGRVTELETLERALDEVRSGLGGRLVLLGGEAGMGRTRLVSEAAARWRGAGVPVHVAGCPPGTDGGAIPFAPFTGLLRSVVRSVDARLLDDLLGPGRAELALLLPELGEPADRPADEAGAARLFESVLLLLERVADRSGGVAVVLEDLHRADRSARDLLAWIAQEALGAPLLLAVTYRSDLPGDHPLPPLVAELERLHAAERLELGPLAPDEARVLIARAGGAGLSDDERNGVLRRAAGNPFYLEELAVTGEGGALPPSVRIAVAQRLAALDAEAAGIARLVAVAGVPVDPPLLAAAAGLDRERSAAASATAADARLVRALPGGPGVPDQLEPGHPLVAEAIAGSLPPGGRSLLHATWAEALRRHPSLGPATALERTALLARHLRAAGDRDGAVPVLLDAAAAAAAVRAFPEADAFAADALALAGPRLAALVPDLAAALDTAATAAWLAGDPWRAIDLGSAAIAAGPPTGPGPGPAADPAGLLRRLHLAAYLATVADHARAASLLDELASEAPAGPVRLRALIALGRSLTALGATDRAILAGTVAVDLARTLGDRRGRTRAGVMLGLALAAAGLEEEAGAVLASARGGPGQRASADAPPSRASRVPDALAAYVDEATLLAGMDDLEGSLAVADRGRARAADAGLGHAYGPALAAIAAWDLARLGRWDEAADLVAASAGPDPATGPGDRTRRPDPATGSLDAVGAWLAARQGRWDDADRRGARCARVDLGSLPGGDWAAVAAIARAEAERGRGRFHEARRAVRDGLAAPEPAVPGTARAELALAGLVVDADAAAAARVRPDPVALEEAIRSGEEAVVLARAAIARPGARAAGARSIALAVRLDAEAARLAGHPGVEAWHAAVHAADRVPDALLAAEARVGLAAALLESGVDRAEPAATLEAAAGIAAPLGAVPLLDAIERLLRRARLAPRSGRAVPPDGPRAAAAALGLSERETEVLELIAAGRSDRQIARELFITEKTAGHHVSHILTKLTVTRRGEAAAIAHRIGLSGPAGEPPEA